MAYHEHIQMKFGTDVGTALLFVGCPPEITVGDADVIGLVLGAVGMSGVIKAVVCERKKNADGGMHECGC